MISADAWKLIVSMVSTTIAAVAVAVGVWQYLEEGKRNRLATERRTQLEFNQALWEEEFKTYRDISAAVGDLVAAVEMGDSVARKQAEMAFRALYWGRAILVEADSVQAQMVTFRERFNEYAQGKLTGDQFKKAASDLSDALKKALRLGAEAARQGPAPNVSAP